ncbi:hypothetical protein [Mesorhizobium sp. M0968]|uniref:hypothetical protein n=1 Tax=Mesorhizobium sp. M0968 TaxID=2957037 RepID=UPI0033382E19
MRRAEQRVTGQFLRVQYPSGIVVSIPGWMVDSAACAGMTFGPPQVDLTALSDLKRLVMPVAVSANFPSKNGIAREKVDEQHNVPAPTSGRQMSLIFEPHRLEGMSKVERAKALLTLAQRLMQAAGHRRGARR